MTEPRVPPEALERLMSVLIWGWLNAHHADFSVEDVAEEALAVALAYIDENCPEWYGRRWLRREEMEVLDRAVRERLERPEGASSAVPRLDVARSANEEASAQLKLTKALRPAA